MSILSTSQKSPAAGFGPVLTFIMCWAAAFLFYWWLVAKSQLQQLAAGAIFGLGVTWFAVVITKQAGLRFRFRPGWALLLAKRLPREVLRDLGLLGAELIRSLVHRGRATGAFKEIPFEAGRDDPASAARRALVVGGVSTPPNSIAVSIESNGSILLVHQLVFRSESPGDREWPV